MHVGGSVSAHRVLTSVASVATHRCGWLPTGADGTQWLPIGADGTQWGSVATHRCGWHTVGLPTGADDTQWGYPQVRMAHSGAGHTLQNQPVSTQKCSQIHTKRQPERERRRGMGQGQKQGKETGKS